MKTNKQKPEQFRGHPLWNKTEPRLRTGQAYTPLGVEHPDSYRDGTNR